MKILALDQSSKVTGWSLFQDQSLISFGVVKAEDENYGSRYLFLVKEIEKLLIENKVEKLVLEDIQMQVDKETHQKVYGEGNIVSVTTFKTLAQVQGVLMLLAAKHEMPVEFVSSSAWKSSCGIAGMNRTEQKRSAQMYIEKKYNVKAIQDICDAICLGEHAANPGREKPKERIDSREEYKPVSWD